MSLRKFLEEMYEDSSLPDYEEGFKSESPSLWEVLVICVFLVLGFMAIGGGVVLFFFGLAY